MSKLKERVNVETIRFEEQEEIVKKVWVVILGLTILPFLLLANYTYPSIHDDYLTANAILRNGRVQYIIDSYNTWTGRYSELVLKAYLQPLTYQHTWLLEKIGAILIILSLLASIYFLLKVLAKEKKITAPFATALLLLALFVNGLSAVGPVFYWFDGYTAYTVGIVAYLVLLSCLVALHQKQRNNTQRFYYFTSACFAIIVGVGSYETVLLAIGWLLATALIFALRQQQPIRWWLPLVVLWLISAWFSLTAPGNMGRATSALPDHVDLFSVSRLIVSGVKSVYFVSSTLVSWSNNLLLVLGTVILLPVLTRRQSQLPSSCSIRNGRQLALLLLWIIVGLSVCVFPSILIYQTVWEHTWQCIYAFFLLGWVFSAVMAFAWLRPKYAIVERALSTKVQLVCRVAFLLICFGGSNSNTNMAYLDLKFRAPEYYQHILQRTLDMQQARSLGKAGRVVPVLPSSEIYKQPKILYTVPYNDNDAVGFAHYYGVDSVVAMH